MTRLRHISGRSRVYLGIFLIVAAFYWKLTLTSQFEWLWGPDLAGQVLPWFEVQARAWNEGRIALWDPYLWAGQPLLGQTQPGTAYPLNWILFSLPLENGHIAPAALQWYFVLIHVMAALFGYWLCRGLGQSRLAAMAGGLVFSLGGYIGGTGWPQMLNGAIWFPLVFLFLVRALDSPNFYGNAALSGMFLGISFLSGHHQIPIFASVVVAGVWLFFILRPGRVDFRRVAGAAITFVITGLTAAFQLLPAIEYGRLAKRWVGAPAPVGWGEVVPYYVHDRFQLKGIQLLALVFPNIRPQYAMFIGVTALALAVIGVVICRRDLRARIVLGTGVFGLVYAVGPYTAVQGLLYSLVPWLDKARAPSAAVFFIDFAAAVLVGYGLDHLASSELSEWPRRVMWAALALGVFITGMFEVIVMMNKTLTPMDDQVMMSAVVCFAVAILLYGSIRHRFAHGRALITILLVLELSFTSGYLLSDRTAQGRKDWTDRITSNQDIARYLSRQPGFLRAEPLGGAFEANWGAYHGIEMWGGQLASVTSNLLSLEFSSESTRKLYGVAFAVGEQAPPSYGAPVFTGASGLKVYRQTDAFPRAWAVHQMIRLQNPAEERDFIGTDFPRLHTTAFTLEPPPKLTQCDAPDDVALLQHKVDQIRIRADMGCDGMVVLSDTYYPGWRARVDSQLAPIYEVNGAMRGILVPAGRHFVTLRYRPMSAIVGAAVTIFGILLSLALYWLGRRRHMGEVGA